MAVGFQLSTTMAADEGAGGMAADGGAGAMTKDE